MLLLELYVPVLCSVFLLAWHFVSKVLLSREPRRKSLPGPTNYPLIGSAFTIAWKARNATNVELCRKLCFQYGPIMTFQAGVQKFVVIEDYETGKAVLASDDWHARFPNTTIYLGMTLNQKAGILFSDGDHWKEIRRFTLRSLREFGFGHLDAMENSLQDELSEFLTRFEEKYAAKDEEVCLHLCFTLPTLNLVWRLLCGTRFLYDDEEMIRLLPLIEEAIAATSIGTKPEFAFPFLRHIPGATDHPHLLKMFYELQTMFRNIIAKRRESKAFLTSPNDYIDYFLAKIEESKDTSSSQVYTEDQLIQSSVDLLLASSDTTANALEFAIFYLIKNPEVQQNIQDEIDMVIGNKRRPAIDDRANMSFTEATILETLRKANIAPMGIRTCVRDTVIAGCVLPKNTFALINKTHIHNDPNIWGDPEVFRPSRFIDENNNLVNDNKLIVFGGGRRLCVGNKMARSSMFVFLTSLLQLYTFEESDAGCQESVSSGFTNTLNPFYCKVKRRVNV